MATLEDGKVNDLVSDSNCIYDVLDKVGYSKELAEKRVKICENVEKCYVTINRRNWFEGENNVFIPGSVGEGLEGLRNMEESDFDVLFVQSSVKCFEKNPSADDYDKNKAVFQLDTVNAPSGYTWLESKTSLSGELGNKHSVLENLRKASYERSGQIYLRNDGFFVLAIEDNEDVGDRAGWLRKQFEFEDRSGPSRPFKLPLPFLGKLSIDYVPAFPCSYPSLVNWCTRHRKYDWPSKDLIDCIAKSEVFVVPVRRNDTDDNYWLQWRLSFTLAERALVRSFNDVQIKLYAAMKLLAKCHLKPVCDQVTSYIVKNLVFWAFEDTKNESLTKENLCQLLLQILHRMKKAFEEKHLSNYMTPERNLFEDKISDKEFTFLRNQLDEIMIDVRKALFECQIIQKMLQKDDEGLKELKWRALSEEFLYAIGAIPPEQCDKVEMMIHQANSFFEIVLILLKDVVPIIRQENPHGFFNLLVSMSNEEILQIAIEMYSRSLAI